MIWEIAKCNYQMEELSLAGIYKSCYTGLFTSSTIGRENPGENGKAVIVILPLYLMSANVFLPKENSKCCGNMSGIQTVACSILLIVAPLTTQEEKELREAKSASV